MTAYIVAVEYVNYDDDTTDEFFGPFTSRDTADRFRDRVNDAIRAVQTDVDGERAVYVNTRPVWPPRVRPIRAEAARFTADREREADPYAVNDGIDYAAEADYRAHSSSITGIYEATE